MPRAKQRIDANGNKTTRHASDALIAANMVRMQKEHKAMFERLSEIEEVSKDGNGRIYWRSCGKFIDGSGDVGSDDEE